MILIVHKQNKCKKENIVPVIHTDTFFIYWRWELLFIPAPVKELWSCFAILNRALSREGPLWTFF